MSVFVTAANQTEREGGKIVLQRLKQKGQPIARLDTIWVDGGFTGDLFMMWVMDTALPAVTRYTFLSLTQLLNSFQDLGCTS